MTVAGYLFDYGGTLDTAGTHWARVLWHACERHQLPFGWPQFSEAYVHVERLLGSQPVIRPEDTFHDTLQKKISLELDYLAPLCTGLDLRQVADDLLDDVYARTEAQTALSRRVLEQLAARVPLVLVSNFYGNLSVVLQEFRLNDLFHDVIESAVVGIRKPDVRIFELGLRALGCEPEEAVVVGDSVKNDIRPAHQLGCQTVWFQESGVRRLESGDRSQESCPLPPEADRVIHDLKELTLDL